MLRLRELHPSEHIALFSHGDVIESALAYFLGTSLDPFCRMVLDLASESAMTVSAMTLSDTGPTILCVNNTTPEHRHPACVFGQRH